MIFGRVGKAVVFDGFLNRVRSSLDRSSWKVSFHAMKVMKAGSEVNLALWTHLSRKPLVVQHLLVGHTAVMQKGQGGQVNGANDSQPTGSGVKPRYARVVVATTPTAL